MKKKKVLMVSCEGLGNGGVQAVMMSIVRNFHKEFLFDMLLFTEERRHYDETFLSYGGKIHRIPYYEGNNVFRKKIDYYIRGHHIYAKVLSILDEGGPYDIVHCNNEFESAMIVKAASKVNIPIRIVHTHVISLKPNVVALWLEKQRRRVIEKYATIKLGCSVEACESFYLRSENSRVLNNPYDNKKFDKRYKSVMKEIPFHLLQIGSFSPIKNQLFSIKVIEYIKKTYPDILLTLVGFPTGDYEHEMRKEIDKKNLQSNVRIMPSDSDTPDLLSKSSGFIFPSLREGFGIVLIEAQAMGVKCYSSTAVPKITNCGGVTYIPLSDGPEQWAKKIIRDYEKNQGRHGDFDVSSFTMENVMEQYACIYRGDV